MRRGNCYEIAEFEYRYGMDHYPGIEATLRNRLELGIAQVTFNSRIDEDLEERVAIKAVPACRPPWQLLQST
jgi:hypothetical protein